MHIYLPHSSKTTLHCIHFKGSLFHFLHRLYRCNTELQSSKRIIIFYAKICNMFSLNSSRVVYTNCLCTKNNIYTKINHQLFSARSLKKGRRRACMEIIFLTTELIRKFTPFSFNIPFEFDQLSLKSSFLFFLIIYFTIHV